MTTALDIVTGAAKLLQVLRKGEALDADEAADGLESLNDMIDSWSNEGLMIVSRAWENFSISAASSYTIGTGQTLNTTRPISIQEAFIRIGTIDYPLTYLTDEEYERIQYKTQTTTIPQYYSYDNAYPYGTIRLYPQFANSGTLFLLSEKPISNLAGLSTSVDMPAGWKRALKYNLAVELAPQYNVDVDPSVALGAANSKAAVSLAIAKARPVKYETDKTQVGNIYSGWIT